MTMTDDVVAAMAPEEELLTLAEAIALLGISRATMHRLLDQGKLLGMKAGKQWRFRRADLVAYLERGPVALALANLPIQVLDAELQFLADALAQAGAPCTEPETPLDEAGKVALLAQRLLRLVYVRRASDLHLEPLMLDGEECLRVRLRVDGILREVRRLPMSLHQPLVMHFKQLAGMNLDERKIPMNGGYDIKYDAMRYRFRLSVLPTLYGEGVALRTIPWKIPTSAALGIEHTPLRRWFDQSHGLILVTGPTGSGKATSLVACLYERVTPEVKVITVEEPVEYLIPGVEQLRVEGFTEAEGIRALAYHDPDIVLVGEIRESSVVPPILGLAETGHLVAATMHVKHTCEALDWLVRFGGDPALIAANLLGISLQVLFPKLCPHCKTPAPLTEEQLALFVQHGGDAESLRQATCYRAVGCEQCHGTGYAGRDVLLECFEFTDATRTAFLRGATQQELRDLSLAAGTPTLWTAAIGKMMEGIASAEAVLKKLPR